MDTNESFFGKFDSISGQVEQHLPQSDLIEYNGVREIIIYLKFKFNVFFLCFLIKELFDLLHNHPYINGFRRYFNLSGFYFRKVENIIDERQQGFATVEDG